MTEAEETQDVAMGGAEDLQPDAGSSDDDSDSSSDSDVEISAEDMQKLMTLEGELEANSNLYDKHIEYINLVRGLKLRVKLREAHERMAAKFPLTDQLWLDWVNDELETVQGEEDVEYIKGLMRRATEDYVSVDLWAQYLAFVSELDTEVRGFTSAGLKSMRDLCEAAITAVGLHVTQGTRVWELYRDFEEAYGATLTGADAAKHVDKVRSLYHRQLALPLQGNEEILAKYTEWEKTQGQGVPAHISKAVSKAGEALALRRAYEDAISADKEADASLLAAYMAYIKLEQAQGDPARVQLLYERAVAVFPLTVELWAQYTRYLLETLKTPAIAARVALRATRNCYWSGPLWASAIRTAELARHDTAAITKIKDDALTAGMQGYEDYLEVLLAHIDVLRRSVPTGEGSNAAASSDQGTALRAAFQAAATVIATYFPDQPDVTLRLPSYWAHCEARVLGDAVAARQVWEDALKTPLNRYSETWLAYANMERALRHVNEARGVYKKACSRRFAEPGHAYAMCMEWLRFEREEGSAEDYAHALAKAGPVLDEAAAAAADAGAHAQAQSAAKAVQQLSKEEMAAKRRQNDPHFKDKNAKAQKNQEAFKAPASKGSAAKRGHAEADQEGEAATAKRLRTSGPENGGHVAETQQQQQQPVSAASSDQDMADVQHDGAEDSHGESLQIQRANEHTAFVKGLPYGTKEQQLREFFKDCGALIGVRIPKHHQTGKPRNFAYIDFRTAAGLTKAVELNGSCLPGSDRPLEIAKSAPPGRGADTARGGFGRGGRGGRGGFQQVGRGGGGGGRGQGTEGADRSAVPLGAHATGRPTFGLGYAARKPAAHPKTHLAVDGGATDTKAGAGGAAPTAADTAPKSNADFRAMLFAKKQ